MEGAESPDFVKAESACLIYHCGVHRKGMLIPSRPRRPVLVGHMAGKNSGLPSSLRDLVHNLRCMLRQV